MTVAFTVDATDGAARVGTLRTTRGVARTPVFMPVGTRGTVRPLDAGDLDALGVEIVLANTYHLMLRPGVDVVADLGGLHRFSGWTGLTLTDSGGYQVFSLGPRVDDDGVTFRSTYDGSTHRVTPEGAVDAQRRIGADIQMVLDVCPGLPAPDGVVREAVDRTAAWAARAREHFDRAGEATQALFGIVQGGVDPALRADSAARTVEIGFDGYGIGGLSVGEGAADRIPALAAAIEHIPSDRPRYLMGVGDPLGVIDAVATGVDMFDCVLPTRLGRHGTALTAAGRINLRNRRFRVDDGPIDPSCGCRVCARWSRAFVRHLLVVQEPTARRLLTLHNLAWLLALVDRIRDAVATRTLDALRAEVASGWQ